VEDGPSQKHFFPRNSVVLEKAFADDQPEMEMNMDQLATAFIVAEKAHCFRMITVGHGWKELEIPREQYHLDAMLVVSCHEQVDIALAGEHRMEAPAALPIAVGNLLLAKFVQNLHQPRWHRIFGA
jgi:hypothetical protein